MAGLSVEKTSSPLYEDDDDPTVESCGACPGVEFYLLSGGGIQCSHCGLVLHDFWIPGDGVLTKTLLEEEKENVN